MATETEISVLRGILQNFGDPVLWGIGFVSTASGPLIFLYFKYKSWTERWSALGTKLKEEVIFPAVISLLLSSCLFLGYVAWKEAGQIANYKNAPKIVAQAPVFDKRELGILIEEGKELNRQWSIDNANHHYNEQVWENWQKYGEIVWKKKFYAWYKKMHSALYAAGLPISASKFEIPAEDIQGNALDESQLENCNDFLDPDSLAK